jgi:hypothetical protein
MYPARYQLKDLSAHVLGLLERRREGIGPWSPEAESKLTERATEALAEAGKQFAEVADDKPYWARVEKAVLEVALPRYFAIARQQQALEANKYGVWRGGDLIARGTYAVVGLLVAFVLSRTVLPEFLELLPVVLFLFGPLIPDLQVWAARRRWSNKLQGLVDEMGDEQAQQERYRPLEEIAGAAHAPPPKERDRA